MLTTAPDAEVAAPDRTRRRHPSRDLLPLVLSVLVLAGAMWPLRRARFGIIDDHTIVAMLAGHRRLPIGDVGATLADYLVEPLGRFRPLYWVGLVVESTTAGSHAGEWYVDRFVLAAVTMAGVYWACVLVVPAWSAALIGLTTVLGYPFETWSGLGAAEVYAMPLLAVGICLLVRRCRHGVTVRVATPGLWFLVLAALAKENFVLVSTAGLVVLMVLVGPRHLSRREWLSWGLLAAVSVADLAMIAIQISRHGSQYSQVRDGSTIESWTRFSLQAMTQDQGLLFSVPAALLLVLAGRRRGKRLWGVLLGAGALYVVQVLFYAGASHQGRYLYPQILIGPLVWVVVLLRTDPAPARETRRIRAVIALWAVLGLTVSIVPAYRYSHEHAARTAAATATFERRLDRVKSVIARTNVRIVVLQPVEPLWDQERVVSLARYLTADSGSRVMTLPATSPSTPVNRSLGDQLAEWSSHGEGLFSLVPYHRPRRCLSIMFGPGRPVCPESVESPG